MPPVGVADPQEMLQSALSLPAVRVLAERLGAEFVPAVLLVGGAVRDLLMGLRPVDLDLMVEGPVGALATALGGDQLRLHDRFATATIELEGSRCDIARARREVYPAPGALPEVQPASAAEDLRRRDFTVNAIALALTGPGRGELLAAPDALADLDARRLRVLHRRSFNDDPTRLLRLARYAARLHFEVEPETLALARRAVAEGALLTVSGARIGNELRLLAQEGDPVAALEALAALGIDRAIDPRLGLRDASVLVRALALLPDGERRDRLALAAALLGASVADSAALLDHLAFTAGDREAIVAAATQAESLSARLEMAGQPSQIGAAVGGAGAELVALAGALGPTSAAREWLMRLRTLVLEISGDDLLAAGVPEGPGIGAALAAARAALLDGEATDRASQLAVALRAARAA
jgi:tRNA nucleotidyltransferase (CCA-adding enzyme)